MATDKESGIDDLLAGLEQPLWTGVDEAFTEDAREALGFPTR